MTFLRRYPSSFLRLILLGYGVVLLPLLFAGVYGLWSVERLVRDGAGSMNAVVEVERYRRLTSEQFLTMERVLRQHQIVGDPRLIDEYGSLRQPWRRSVAEFVRIDLVAHAADRFLAIVATEEAVYGEIRAARGDDARVAKLAPRVYALRAEFVTELAALDQAVSGAVARFRLDAGMMQNRMLVALALAVPLSLLIVTAFRAAFGGVLGSFEGAIRQLGDGRLDREIRIDGPSDVRFLGERLDWLRRRLVDLENERGRFLRSVSHELKTPLAALREGTQLLADGVAGELSAQQRKVTQIMRGSVLRLQSLIDDLLQMQRLAHESDRVTPTPVALGSLVRDVVTAHLLTAGQRRIRFNGPVADVTVEGSGERLRVALDNLVSNAVKFSPDGGQVEVTLTRADELAVIEVKDQGPGIPPAERERVFEAFVRAKGSAAIEGSGLGLAIARECVSAHRGTLGIVDSELGACFRMTLPMKWRGATA